MSVCPSCGSIVPDSAKFCTSCGTALKKEPIGQPAQTAPQEPAGAAPVSAEQPKAAGAAPSAGAAGAAGAAAGAGAAGNAANFPQGGVQGTYNASASSNPYAPGKTTSEGILGQAWKDVKESKGWLTKSFLLGLISVVPVLNFVTGGYAARWGRKAAFRTGDALPEGFFDDHSFATGFYLFIISLVWMIVSWVLNLVPVIGGIVALLLLPVLFVSHIHVAMLYDLGAGFRVSKFVDCFKRNYGGLMLITYVPSLLACIPFVIVTTAATIILGLGAVGGGLTAATLSSDLVAATTVAGLGLGTMLVLLVLVYLCMVVFAVVNLVVYRAMGYWVARFEPELVQEAVQVGQSPL